VTLFSTREERVIENLRIINSRFPRKPKKLPVRGERPVVALGGSAPTLVIAALNSLDSTKAKADYICLGVDDHLVIMQALNQLWAGGGGRILLTEGDFYLGDTIVLYKGVRFEGMGVDATRLHSAVSSALAVATNATMFYIDHSPSVGSTDPFSFSYLDLDGHKAIQTSGTPSGIFLESSGGSFITLNDVWIHGFRGNGITSDRCADDLRIERCSFTLNTGDGLQLSVEGDFYLANSQISGNTGRGIKADGANMKIIGCVVRSNGSHGFSAGGVFESTPKLLIGNEFVANGGYGIEWDGVNGVIANNYIWDNTQDGIIAYGNEPLVIVGNEVWGNDARGVTLTGGAGNQGGLVEGNVVRRNGQHGIYVASDDWTVQGNRVNDNGRATTNTYDGIHVAAGVATSILTNMVRQTTGAPVQRYGINITAGATGCWRAGNDCRGGGWGTAAYVDAGAASILVWAGGAGDNQ
jgi:parallel beta-helix repeat protein